MERNEYDYYVLSTGKKFYANLGIIGMSPELDCIYDGYDGRVTTPIRLHDWNPSLTPKEQVEVASYMVNLWLAYASKMLDIWIESGGTK